jgi:hypothetical protein
MSKDTLIRWRFIIPAIILMAVAFPLVPGFDLQKILEISISTDSIVVIGAALLVGTIYYILKPRDIVMRKALLRVNENIKDKLLSPFETDKVIGKSIRKLREGNKMLDIFYNFVDNDKSLEERTKSVYFNGLLLSSFADLRIILMVATAVYLGVYLLIFNTLYLWIAIIWLVIFLSTYIFIPMLINRHISLSDTQLNYIILTYKKELRQKIINAIK